MSPDDVRTHPIFKALQADITEFGLPLSKLRIGSAPISLYNKATPGYYSEQGLHIIEGVITYMFPKHEMEGGTLDLLEAGSLIHFFLVPVIATSLIVEDLSITTKEAYSVMLNSRQIGRDAFQCQEEDDQECDDILHDAMKTIKGAKLTVRIPPVVDNQGRPKPRMKKKQESASQQAEHSYNTRSTRKIPNTQA